MMATIRVYYACYLVKIYKYKPGPKNFNLGARAQWASAESAFGQSISIC